MPGSSDIRSRTRRGAIAAAVIAASAILVGPSLLAAPSPSERKDRVDRQLGRTQDRLAAARRNEAVLTGQVAAYTGRIRQVEARLAPLETRLGTVQTEVTALRARLAVLTSELRVERTRLAAAEDALAKRQLELTTRLLEIYRRGEPDPLLALLEADSLTSAFEVADFLERASRHDGELVRSTRDFAATVRTSRDRIEAARVEADAAENRRTIVANELKATTDSLKTRRAELDRFRGGRATLLSRVRGDRREIQTEAEDLQKQSQALAAKIVAAQGGFSSSTASTGPPSARGFSWPVNGPLTSGFGYRWGRLHEGVDIGVGEGTPVTAAASGTVITAGWTGGYGNLVVIDHGGGIATAYGHNSKLLVSVGQTVGQGSVIASSGNTGHSTGPHVHFEVRVNGTAVDPIPYL
jgi:murein DD-endopeptidase MepM/ murein hydrolase activator NlpD